MALDKCKNCEHVVVCWGEHRPEVPPAKKIELKRITGELADQVTATSSILQQLSELARSAFCEAARQWDESSALVLADAAADLKRTAEVAARIVFRIGLEHGAQK